MDRTRATGEVLEQDVMLGKDSQVNQNHHSAAHQQHLHLADDQPLVAHP